MPRAPVGRGLTAVQRGRRAVTAAVVAAGFVEVLSFPFATAEELDKLGVPAGDRRRRLNRIANPLAETSPYLRTTLLPGLFGAVARNRSRGNDDLALVETGSVFYAAEPARSAPRPAVTGRPTAEELAAMDAALGEQPRHLAAVLTGSWRASGWQGGPQPAGWQQALAVTEVAARALGVTLVRRAAEQSPWHPGRCAEIATADGVVARARRRAAPAGGARRSGCRSAPRRWRSICRRCWPRPRRGAAWPRSRATRWPRRTWP